MKNRIIVAVKIKKTTQAFSFNKMIDAKSFIKQLIKEFPKAKYLIGTQGRKN